MADLYMLGKVSKEEHPYFGNEYWFYIGRIEDGEDEDYVSFTRGESMLGDVMFLWNLITPERRKAYYDFLKNEIEIKENHRESGGYLICPQKVKQILEMIDDLDKKLEKFLDSNGRVKEEYVDFISRTDSGQTFDDNSFNYDGIRNEISNVKMMKHFLNQAIELNYPLIIG